MFKNPFSFEGRIRRTEYGLSLIIAAAGRVFISMILASGTQEDLVFLNFIFQIPFLWFFWAEGAKRCHDVGMSGWYQLIPLFPLYLIFASGEEGSNIYGENPKVQNQNF
jgi:uncharacterized membrane protein YhaH (DUF805 family)